MLSKIFKATLFSVLSTLVYGQTMLTIVDSNPTMFRDDIILDYMGNLYCADYGGSNVYKRTPDGTISTFVTGLATPNGLAFDSNNDLFVCDNVGSKIYKIDLQGNFLDTIDAMNPSGIIKEFDSDTMIVTEYGTTHTLSKVAPDGTITITHSDMGLNGPVGLEYDNTNQLYVANFNDRRVFKVMEDTLIYWATVPGPTNGTLGFLAYGGGFLWATSWQDNKIYGLSTTTPDSSFLLVGSSVGGDDGPLDIATLNSPNGIWSNSTADTMYISEYTTGKLRMIKPDIASIQEYGIKNNENTLLFPNPAAADSKVRISDELDFDVIHIYDLTGKLLNIDYESKEKGLYFEASGTYLIHFIKDEQRILSKMMIVK